MSFCKHIGFTKRIYEFYKIIGFTIFYKSSVLLREFIIFIKPSVLLREFMSFCRSIGFTKRIYHFYKIIGFTKKNLSVFVKSSVLLNKFTKTSPYRQTTFLLLKICGLLFYISINNLMIFY